MAYYTNYLQRLIGGDLNISRYNIEPGHIVAFRYRSERSRRKLNRIVLVLGKFNKGSGMMIHGVNLEHIPIPDLALFLKKVIIKDTLSLIKRKFELKGPFSQLIDQPKSFYQRFVKNNLLEFDCYRTYKLLEIKQPKIHMLDWKRLRIFDNTTKKQVLITQGESLVEINEGRKILNKVLGKEISVLNNATFKKVVKERFGSFSSFYELLDDIKNFVDEPNFDETDEFNASKY